MFTDFIRVCFTSKFNAYYKIIYLYSVKCFLKIKTDTISDITVQNSGFIKIAQFS